MTLSFLFCRIFSDFTLFAQNLFSFVLRRTTRRKLSLPFIGTLYKKSSQEVRLVVRSRLKKSSLSRLTCLSNTCTLLSNTCTLYCIIILYFIIITGATLSASASGRKFPTVICASPRTLDHDPETWLPQDNTRARECIWPVTNSHTQLHPKRLP